MDDAGVEALREAIRRTHGCEATFVESVPVCEEHEGRVVWEGEVQVFDVAHSKASRAYAWSHPTEAGRRRFYAVLGVPPVNAARDAVRASIVADAKMRTQ